MINRVVNFGCCFSLGSEMTGEWRYYHPDNTEYNYGKKIADELNVPFEMAAWTGNAFKQISEDIIHLAQPDDLCLIGWTVENFYPIYPEPTIGLNEFIPMTLLYGNVLGFNVKNELNDNYMIDMFGKEFFDKKVNMLNRNLTIDQQKILYDFYKEFQMGVYYNFRDWLESYYVSKLHMDSIGCQYLQWFNNLTDEFVDIVSGKPECNIDFFNAVKLRGNIAGQNLLTYKSLKLFDDSRYKIFRNDPQFLTLSDNGYNTMFNILVDDKDLIEITKKEFGERYQHNYHPTVEDHQRQFDILFKALNA